MLIGPSFCETVLLFLLLLLNIAFVLLICRTLEIGLVLPNENDPLASVLYIGGVWRSDKLLRKSPQTSLRERTTKFKTEEVRKTQNEDREKKKRGILYLIYVQCTL